MDNVGIFILATAILILLFLIVWFRTFRKKVNSFIAPPKSMPQHFFRDPKWFEEDLSQKVIWKVTEPEIQPVNNVQCVAYSLHELMESPPLEIKDVPSINELFEEFTERDDQKDNSQGGNQIGAFKYLEQLNYIGKTNFLVRFLRKFGLFHSFFNFENVDQIKQFVKSYSPVIAGIEITTVPKIDVNGILYSLEGNKAFGHSILIYGFDDDIICPDGQSGAFKVRWHLDWFGTDGWIPYTLAEKALVLNWTYGYNR